MKDWLKYLQVWTVGLLMGMTIGGYFGHARGFSDASANYPETPDSSACDCQPEACCDACACEGAKAVSATSDGPKTVGADHPLVKMLLGDINWLTWELAKANPKALLPKREPDEPHPVDWDWNFDRDGCEAKLLEMADPKPVAADWRCPCQKSVDEQLDRLGWPVVAPDVHGRPVLIRTPS